MNGRHPMDEATSARKTCRARNRQGGQCKRSPVPGALVCNLHGGKAPQVQRSARARLLEAADPAAARLVQLLETEDPAVALRAATALLDRAGHGPSSTQVQVDGGAVNYEIAGVDLKAL